MTVAVAWIADGWIFSTDPEQDSKFRIVDNWIWGPVGADDRDTKYWVGDGWIWGPAGAPDVATGFYIAGGWIYGPGKTLPFAR